MRTSRAKGLRGGNQDLDEGDRLRGNLLRVRGWRRGLYLE